MNLAKSIIRRKYAVIAVWVIAILAMTPAVMDYSHYIQYSNQVSSNIKSESSQVSNIIEKAKLSNSTLFILITKNPYNSTLIANRTLDMQAAISSAGLRNLSSTSSPFSAYASFIDKIIKNNATSISSIYNSTMDNATRMYSFPAAFYRNWSSFSYRYDDIYSAAVLSGYESSNNYEKNFIQELNTTAGANGVSGNLSASDPLSAVMQAISVAYNISYPQYSIAPYNPGSDAAYNFLGLFNFTNSVSVAVSDLYRPYFTISPDLVNATIQGGNVGINYIRSYGLKGMPSFLAQQFISPDGSTFLVDVQFNVPSGYIGPNDFQPSASATPKLESIVSQYFGNSAMVTGSGAINEQIQQITAKSAFVFGILFIILAIAVTITLVSWKSGLISLVFVSLATLLGYVSIFITGLILHGVSYIVNYTLTAVAVGVSTDYLVFIASRYRQELREGRDSETALELATGRAGRAVLISGVTVGLSLAMFSFIPGFTSWGLVLILAILMIVALETTLFPAVVAIFGPRFFTKGSIARVEEGYHKKSKFHKAARFSNRRKYEVIGLILLLGIPAGYFFLHVPTTYNFNTGLPDNLPSVKALNLLQDKFGSNLLYPIEVLLPVNASGNHFTPQDNRTILNTTEYLLSISGVHKVVGPYSNGTSINSSFSPSQYSIDNGKYVVFLVYSDFSPYSQQAINQVNEMRSNHSILVGGITSGVIDQESQNSVIYPELEVLIISVIFVVLLISFRSPKYPIISLSGVFISISWTTAILYLLVVYVLHQSLIYLIPIILFIILMSLGNDYTVFIVSSVKEYERKVGFAEGMPRGMASSGKVVTSLGLILAASLGSLGFIPDGFLEQLGIAFFISLIIDTFIIRTFYFPGMLSALRKGEDAQVMESGK